MNKRGNDHFRGVMAEAPSSSFARSYVPSQCLLILLIKLMSWLRWIFFLSKFMYFDEKLARTRKNTFNCFCFRIILNEF